MSARLKPLLGVVGGLLAALLLLALLFDWNWLKRPIEALIEDQLGREIQIAGALEASVSLTPRIVAHDVRLANAEWGSEPDMLQVDRLAFVLDVRRLIGGRLDISDLSIEGADVLLERRAGREVNWQLDRDGEEALAPIVGEFEIENATVRYRDPGFEDDLQLAITAAQGTGGRATEPLQLQGEGWFANLPLRVALEAGSLNQLQAGEQPYPIDARLAAGDNVLHLAGTVSTPADLQSAEFDLQLDGPDPTLVLAALEITEEPAPPITTTARLVHEGEVWALADLDVVIGGSRATGEVAYDLGEEPAHITARLLSDGLDGEELVRFLGTVLPAEPIVEDPPLVTEEGLEPRSLPRQHIHLDLDARDVQVSPELILDQFRVAGRLVDRVPHVALTGAGRLRDNPVAVELDLGGERTPDGSYPIEARLEVAQNRLALAGWTARPLDLQALEVEVDLGGAEPSILLDLAGYPHLDLPEIELSGQLRRDHDIWELPAFSARTGESDLAGSLRATLGEPRPAIDAELASDHLNIADLEPILDAVQELAEVDAPEVALITVEDGRPRLQPEALPDLDADITYRADRLEGPELDLRDVQARLRLGQELPALRLVAEGMVLGEQTAIDLALGTTDGTDPPPAGYPIEARISAEQSRIEISGMIAEPVALEGLNLEFDLEGPAPARWLELAEWPAPELPPIRASGQLIQDGETWQLTDAFLASGESDLAGTLAVTLAEPRPVIAANLASEQLSYDDLAPFAEVVQEMMPDRPGPALLTFENGRPRLQPEALPQVDADLAYRADRLQGPEVDLQDVEAQLRPGEELPTLRLVGQGTVLGEQVEIDVALGPTEADAQPSGYPVEAQVAGEQTRIALTGAIEDPVALEGIDLQFEIASLAPARWLALAGLPAPEMPSVGAAGQLLQEDQSWHLPDLYLEAADSNLFGEIVVDLAPERPFVRADLQSNRLIVDELRQLVAQEAGGGNDANDVGGGTIFAGLPGVDLDLDLQIDHLRTGEVRLEPLTLQARLREQALIVDLAGEGWFHDSPLTVEAQLGSDAALDDPEARFPVQVLLTTAETEVRAEGSIADPFDLAGLEVELAFQGESLEELGEILQLGLPSTPPYRLGATLRRENAVWTLAGLDGRVGESDIGGEVTANTSGERPVVTVDLRSKRLDFADFGEVVGEVDDGEEVFGEEEPGPPAEEVTFDPLPDVDLGFRYVARNVVARQIPVDEVEIEATLRDGVLRIAPLGFELGVGVFIGELELDTNPEPPQARADLRLHGAEAEYIFDLLEIELPDAEAPLAVGRLDARAELSAGGSTVGQLAETLDGQLAGIVEGGWVTAVLVQQLGMNLLEILGFFAPDPEEMEPVRCFVANFDISGGVMGVEALVLDTEESLITGAGAIDFAAGRVDIAIQSNPKEAQFPVLAPTPVEVTGRFGEIEVGPDPGEVAQQFLAALGLGVVLPVVGAAIPFIEPGLAEDSDCGWLIQEAAQAAEPS